MVRRAHILDPHALMGADPRYLLDVLADDSGPAWRLVVLEDAGELIVHDAGRTGALPALLNLTDGILGHGSGTIVLVTTDELVEHLHPAVRRRGRCLADLEFGPLSAAEAKAWLARAGSDADVEGPLTLAELFALADGGEPADEPVPSHRRLGSACARAGTRQAMTTLFLVAQERGERADRILTGLQWTLGLRARVSPAHVGHRRGAAPGGGTAPRRGRAARRRRP